MKHNKLSKKGKQAFYLRNVVFGIEDSLVSTVGFLSGVNVAQVERPILILTGVILIFVEAFSMGVGSYLSESTAIEYTHGKRAHTRESIKGGIIMFFSYFVTGFIPLAPYILFAGDTLAFWVSIIVSLLTLFALGAWGALLSKTKIWPAGLRMAVIGGIAIGLGVLVGTFIQGIGV